MKSSDIQKAIERINTLKPKDKVAQLSTLMKNEWFELVIKKAYDPFITFGIKKYERPDTPPAVGRDFNQGTIELLSKLQTRSLTGNDAIKAVEDEARTLNKESEVLLFNILNKNLKAGFTAKTVNKAKPGTIFVFSCMLAHPYEEKRVSYPTHVEPKMDGVRVLFISDQSGRFKCYSRSGKEFHNYSHIGSQLSKLMYSFSPHVLDGEVVDASDSFNKTVGDARRKGVSANDSVFHLFDAIPLEEFGDVFDQTYKHRRGWLQDLFEHAELNAVDAPNLKLVPSYVVHSHEETMSIYRNIVGRGGEGVMVKCPNAFYECKRSFGWLKIKEENSVDLVIIRMEEGEGKYEGTLGKLVLDYKGIEVRASGMTDALRDDMWKNREKYIGELAEIEYHEETPDNSLRHPRFVRMRTDKPLEDGAGC